ncbi:MAG: exopolysaccharide Pel transporter PelG [Spirochaetia bacterium]
MAGIGFVLRRVIRQGGFFSLVKVALAGTIIVAGPWLLSIVGIFFITKYSFYLIGQSVVVFMGVVIYSYAFSLFLFGGIHYIFTRLVADYMYVKKKEKAGEALLLFSTGIVILASAVSLSVLFLLDLSKITYPLLFRVSGVVFFVSINLIWLLMIFISLLKKYFMIFIIYLSGMALAFGSITFLAGHFSVSGVLLGFAAGHLFIVISLYLLAFKEYRPRSFSIREHLPYFGKFKFLLLTGILYYWGMWIDKMVFWFAKGSPIANTFFRVYDVYDIPVYIANLTIIPGLIYFMIITETSFYKRLTEFLNKFNKSIYHKLQAIKYRLIANVKNGLREQCFFQGIFTVILILFAPLLVAADSGKIFIGGIKNILVFRIALGATFFQMLFLTIVIFLFYLQRFKLAFFSTLSFFLVNFAGSLIIVLWGNENTLGLSYLAAGIIGSALGLRFLFTSAHKLDNAVFLIASGESLDNL